MTGGHGADIAIEAVGKPETWHWAVNMVRRGGTVNFFGGCPNESKVNLDTNLLHYSEITCKASFHHTPAYIRKALDIFARGDITASAFVNSEEPLANLLEVMRHLMSHNGHLKTAIFRKCRAWAHPRICLRRPFVRSPEALDRSWPAAEGRAYTRWLATHHYENFHVVSFLLPKRLHQDFYNVYAYCRWADDLGDEIGDRAESLRLLDWWRGELDAMYAGRSHASGLRRAARHRRASTAFPGSRSPT